MVIKSRVRVIRGRMPALQEGRCKELIELLYGTEGTEYLQVYSKRKKAWAPSVLAADLAAMKAVVSFGFQAGNEIWYYDETAGDDRAAVGGQDPALRAGKLDNVADEVATPILNFCFGKAWVTCCESRWTHVSATLRRVVLGMCLCGTILV